jgi:hypothetical protein
MKHMKHRRLLINLAVLVIALAAQFAVATTTRPRSVATTKFTVRVENISSADGQTASNGTKWPFALSPGIFVLNARSGFLFKEGKPAANGLQAQAEDGNPAELVSALEKMHHSSSLHGVFNTPVGSMGPGPIGPGAAYEFTFDAAPGMKLSMAFMFGQSNDLFYGNESGIALFDSKGKPVSSDITSELILWDAGTEVNQEPGIGPDQAPRQKSANTGAVENGKVHKAKNSPFYTRTTDLFRVTLTPESGM